MPGRASRLDFGFVWFALSFPELPKVVSVFCTVIVGLVAGGIAGAIPGILHYLGTSEVIVTIMMNFIILCNQTILFDLVLQPTCCVKSEASNKVIIIQYQTEFLSSHFGGSRLILVSSLLLQQFYCLVHVKATAGFEITSVGLNLMHLNMQDVIKTCYYHVYDYFRCPLWTWREQ